jgi:hypothetical protein
VNHDAATAIPADVMDSDIRNGLEIVCEPAIYKEYVTNLGIVSVRRHRRQFLF